MTKRTQLIGRSPRMEQVINLVSRPEFMRILESAYEPERNTFTDRRGGYGGGGDSGYNGYFKVVDASESGSAQRKVRIIDGSSPDSPNAGESDLGYVRAATLEIPNKTLTEILLVAKYNEETNSYEQYFDYKYSGTTGPVSVLLATVDATGAITQQWNSGAIYFGGRFFL